MEYELYIQVENGFPVNHPSYAANLIEVYGAIPANWEPFLRVQNPTLSDNTLVLEKSDPEYQKIDGIWQDVWVFRAKTEAELAQEQAEARAQRIKRVKDLFFSDPKAGNFSAWVFNEDTNKFEPPFPKPDDGKFYRWSGPDNNWKEAAPFPQDGKKYKFDFDNWVNVEVTDV